MTQIFTFSVGRFYPIFIYANKQILDLVDLWPTNRQRMSLNNTLKYVRINKRFNHIFFKQRTFGNIK